MIRWLMDDAGVTVSPSVRDLTAEEPTDATPLKRSQFIFSPNGNAGRQPPHFRSNLHSKQPDLKSISLAGLDSKYSSS